MPPKNATENETESATSNTHKKPHIPPAPPDPYNETHRRICIILAVFVLILLRAAYPATPTTIQRPKDWNEPIEIRTALDYHGDEAGLPRGLSHVVGYHESRFKAEALSRVVDGFRSCGLMQLYRKYLYGPSSLSARFSDHPNSFDWKNPDDNAQVGCRYLAYLINRFGGSVYLGVLAYNWGPTNVQNMTKWSDVPPHCRKYADSVVKMLDEWNETW